METNTNIISNYSTWKTKKGNGYKNCSLWQDVVTQSSWKRSGGAARLRLQPCSREPGYTLHITFCLKISIPLPLCKADQASLFRHVSHATKQDLEFHDDLVSAQHIVSNQSELVQECVILRRDTKEVYITHKSLKLHFPPRSTAYLFLKTKEIRRKSHFGSIRFAGEWMGCLRQSGSIFTFVCMTD